MNKNTINAALRAMGCSCEVHMAHSFRATARTITDGVVGERVNLMVYQPSHAVKDVNA